MKKKVWIIFILVAVACLALGLSACAQTHTHTFAQTWSSDETGHWHEATCGDTEEKRDFASHLYENGACSECGYEHEDHEFTEYTNRTETQHTGTCSICGKVVTENHTYESGACKDCEYEHENHTFTYSNKTETEHTGTCSLCGKTVTENHTYANGTCEDCEYEHKNHNYVYSNKTETQHTGTCSLCGKTVTENHTYANGVCEDCEYEHENHTFDYSNKTETQHTGTCSVCHKTVTENHTYENGTCEDCEYEHTAHTVTEYSNKTETEHTGTCSVCGKAVTENHTYANGVCEDCDYEHENHVLGGYEKNEEGHSQTCSVCHKVVADGHTYENGVCTECEYAHVGHEWGDDGYCSVCHLKKPPYTMNGDKKLYLGSYPQTEVTDKNDSDKSLRNSLGIAAGSEPTAGVPGKWTDYGYYIKGAVTEYMWYIDVDYGDGRYRGVYFTRYRPKDTTSDSSRDNSYQDDHRYYINTAYWFKYEPIEWRVLEQKDGKAFLMANIILDSQLYYHTASGFAHAVGGEMAYENNYAGSDIRAWLNGTFFETAFDESAQEIIETTTVNNSLASTGDRSNPYICENTQDKVFLLSYQEAMITSYGFSNDTARQLKSTDYAKSQGCWQATDSSYRGNGEWWLRSPYLNNSRVAVYINNAGRVYTLDKVNYTCVGVVPALWIRL